MVILDYRPDGWSSQGWLADEYDAWAEHDTDAAWTDAPLGISSGDDVKG